MTDRLASSIHHSRERWRRVRAIFDAAMACDAAERQALLDEHCDGDDALRAEVEALVDAAPHADAYFERLAARTGAPFGSGTAVGLEGRRLGSYRLVRSIGRGGMGAVYLAERDDGQFRKEVAVKLLPLGLRTAGARARFRAERQILARLEHPGIARLLDGGIADDGTPYLVMDYVRGEPIDVWCESRRLSVDARLALFLHVCDAVGYAHRGLVVHRDLKPANILVDETGRVRLLDFGIAKVLADGETDDEVATRFVGRPITPAYASPEQLRGQPVTTATDVYSLGVLLYRLLTGRAPYRFRTGSPVEIHETVCHHEPPPPSRAVRGEPAEPGDAARPDGAAGPGDSTVSGEPAEPEPPDRRARLARRLRGDVDAIVLTALRKDPDLRYPSVAELAADIRRHRAGEPVTARRPTVRYRFSRFLRRHRAGAAAALALLVLALVYTATLSVQASRLAEQRDRAESAAAFLTTVLERLGPEHIRRASAEPRDILDGSVERIRAELDGQPLLQARLLDAVGRAYQYWGLFAEAEAVLEEALAIRLDRLGSRHIEVAESRLHLGVLGYQTSRPGTDSLFTAAIPVLRRELGDDHAAVLNARTNHAIALRADGEYERAERLFRNIVQSLRAGGRAGDLARPQTGADAPNASLATALTYLGKLLTRRGAYEEAESALRDALAARRALHGESHPVVANALDAVGELELARGRIDASERRFAEALAMRREYFAAHHPDVGVSYDNLAAAKRARGDYAAAEGFAARSVEIARAAYGEDSPDAVERAAVLRELRRLAAGQTPAPSVTDAREHRRLR